MKAKEHRIWPLPGLERSNKMPRFFFQSIKEALRSQAACDTAVLTKPGFLWIDPDEYKTEGMCSSTVRRKPYTLMYVPDHFKAQEMCDKAIKDDSYFLQFVSDWFITREWVDMWYDDYYDCGGSHWDDDDDDDDDDEDNFFEWYDGYKKRKAQKGKIEKDLLLGTHYLGINVDLFCAW